jgi:hypothetical protein
MKKKKADRLSKPDTTASFLFPLVTNGHPKDAFPDIKQRPTHPPPERAFSWNESTLDLQRDNDPRRKDRQTDRPCDKEIECLSTIRIDLDDVHGKHVLCM